MKISIDTKEDSHDELRKVIKMLQNIIGDSQEVFSNQPIPQSSPQDTESVFNNIFGDTAAPSSSSAPLETSSSDATNQATTPLKTEEATVSTEDLFAELFSEEELKKMNETEVKKEEEEEEVKPKNKKFNIEFY